ncbi:saccharopine dehydrogenase related protein [Lactobacillus selangorensis]|uniref:Saccharopine dehydrogenase related protein n=1 Tax=Lactobacillus selangorensis TaxID=81857 RepID=A0A0R2FX66_9LACO|nr:NAD(P)H-binding protein [Lactobacillus selangorensis]KRN28676.1 saccharopine dehydrogenase related protein [Lactobacillus selangorensis]KRN32914.1 saccharopine dehydrogenase related protein [Lactobacillus selangorensis]
MQKVLILGATGTVGSAVRQTLLTETDDQLTLFARHPNGLQTNPAREQVIAGDVMSESDLRTAIRGQEVVFAALSGNLGTMAQQIVSAMDAENVTRLIFITSMGIYNEIPAAIGADGNLKFNPALKPYRQAADVIEASDLNYTLIRPGWFDNGNPSYEITHKGEPFGGHNVAVKSIADLVRRLSADSSLGSRDSLGIDRPQ